MLDGFGDERGASYARTTETQRAMILATIKSKRTD
jgi:hypothetical protein